MGQIISIFFWTLILGIIFAVSYFYWKLKKLETFSVYLKVLLGGIFGFFAIISISFILELKEEYYILYYAGGESVHLEKIRVNDNDYSVVIHKIPMPDSIFNFGSLNDEGKNLTSEKYSYRINFLKNSDQDYYKKIILGTQYRIMETDRGILWLFGKKEDGSKTIQCIQLENGNLIVDELSNNQVVNLIGVTSDRVWIAEWAYTKNTTQAGLQFKGYDLSGKLIETNETMLEMYPHIQKPVKGFKFNWNGNSLNQFMNRIDSVEITTKDNQNFTVYFFGQS